MILDDIIRDKKKEIEHLKKRVPLGLLKKKSGAVSGRKNNFLKALTSGKGLRIIAEIKKRSPSRGLFRRDFNAVKIARAYEQAGAAALSILTDKKYFGGSSDILKQVRKVSRLPILRKDFIVDDYQIHESILIGADAILLIARVLSGRKLNRFYSLAKHLRLEVIFEVHDAADLKKVLPLRPRIIGINNRDLATFETDLNNTRRLAGKIPARCVIISESGIADANDLAVLKEQGVAAVLVGETFMKEKDPGRALKRLLGNARA